MKVQLDGKTPAATPSSTPKPATRGVDSPQFADTLKSALGPDKTVTSGAPAPLGGPGGVLPPVGILPAEIRSVDTESLVAAAETVLDRLDYFVAQLSDQRIDSKSMQPLITELSGQKDELSSFFRSLPEDHPLKEIVGDVLDTVFTAIGQFHRGDFGS